MTIFMGIDPGPHNGIAYNIDGVYATGLVTERNELWDLIAKHHPDRLAFEVFIGTGRLDPAKQHTIEIVGSLYGVCRILKIKQYPQQPQTRRPFLPHAKSLLQGKGCSVHEHDALAHLLLLEWRIQKGQIK